LLVNAMFRFETHGLPIVLRVNDETVVEAPQITKEMVETIISTSPSWAAKLHVPEISPLTSSIDPAGDLLLISHP